MEFYSLLSVLCSLLTVHFFLYLCALITIKKYIMAEIYTYESYKELMDNLLKEGKTSGEDQSEFMVSLTKLNRQRIKRLDNTLELTAEQTAFFANLTGEQSWVVISECWCADAAQILPVIAKVAEANPHIHLSIVLRDENPELMNQYLTNGGKAIPILIISDKATGKVLHVWGPRPKTATAMVEAYKKEHGKLSPEFKEDLQKWYNQDKGQSIIQDLISLFS